MSYEDGYYDQLYSVPVPVKGGKPWKKPLRTWEIGLSTGTTERLDGHYCFNNGTEGLTIRRYPKGEQKTIVVKCFAAGYWNSFKEIEDGE